LDLAPPIFFLAKFFLKLTFECPTKRKPTRHLLNDQLEPLAEWTKRAQTGEN